MSFLNKLRGDMGLEEKSEKPKPKKKAKIEVEKETESKKETKPPKKELTATKPSDEGELAIDVFETDGDIVIQSTIGGVRAEDLDIDIENDLVTIRGSRQNKIEREGKKYFYQECYWGSFVRKVILPEEVESTKAKAVIKDGILTLTMPKVHRKIKKKVAVQQEE